MSARTKKTEKNPPERINKTTLSGRLFCGEILNYTLIHPIASEIAKINIKTRQMGAIHFNMTV